MADASTFDYSSSVAVGSRAEPDMPALLLAWSAFEPERIGEVALFEPFSGVMVLGRGEGAGGERVAFHRQRPGLLERASPLKSPGLSREQLRIQLGGDRLHITRVGKCPLIVRGEAVERADIGPGDTLLLKGQLLLYCTKRPRNLGPLQSASLADAPPFGAPDAHGIVGESPAIWRLRDRIAWLSKVDEHTLILGASGSGKELCARAIHGLSGRASGPFIARNAATIPVSILDAELFGNVKGYPNPGMAERPGLIGAANGGTLFLDEIGELPVEAQANLLRVLDEGGEYHNLGGSQAKRSRFRLLGATNRHPAAMKHDLAARLSLRLEVPGLDERLDDIPLLAGHLLRRAAAKSPAATERFVAPSKEGSVDLRVKASLLLHLLQHRYTTHIRELGALLWRALEESPGNAVEWSVNEPSRASPAIDAPIEEEMISAGESGLSPSESEIRAALIAQTGNIAGAARALGLSSRYVLYRLMRRYGIEG